MDMVFLQNVLQRQGITALNIHAHPAGGWMAHARIGDRGFTVGQPKASIPAAVTDTLSVCGYVDPAAAL